MKSYWIKTDHGKAVLELRDVARLKPRWLLVKPGSAGEERDEFVADVPMGIFVHEIFVSLPVQNAEMPRQRLFVREARRESGGVAPVVDKSKIPPRAMGHATARIRSVWRNISTGVDCVQGSPNCGVAPSNLPSRPNPKHRSRRRLLPTMP